MKPDTTVTEAPPVKVDQPPMVAAALPESVSVQFAVINGDTSSVTLSMIADPSVRLHISRLLFDACVNAQEK